MTEQTITIYCFIDSFLVAVCDNIRIQRNRLLGSKAYQCKCVSKRRYFYGFRMQLITTQEGLPVQFYIHASSFVDVTALQVMPLDLPQGCKLYADAGYTCYEVEDLLKECEQVELLICRKSER